MPVRTILATPVCPAGSTYLYQSYLQKETGAPLGPGDLLTLTLVVLDIKTGTVIVGFSPPMNILNAGRGTLTAAGLLSIHLLAADNVLLNANLDQEWHRMRIQWTYGSGDGSWHEVDFPIQAQEV